MLHNPWHFEIWVYRSDMAVKAMQLGSFVTIGDAVSTHLVYAGR
jgi:hypothetical protein